MVGLPKSALARDVYFHPPANILAAVAKKLGFGTKAKTGRNINTQTLMFAVLVNILYFIFGP